MVSMQQNFDLKFYVVKNRVQLRLDVKHCTYFQRLSHKNAIKLKRFTASCLVQTKGLAKLDRVQTSQKFDSGNFESQFMWFLKDPNSKNIIKTT